MMVDKAMPDNILQPLGAPRPDATRRWSFMGRDSFVIVWHRLGDHVIIAKYLHTV